LGALLKLGFAVVVLAAGWLLVNLVSLTPSLLLAWVRLGVAGQASGILDDIVLLSSALAVGALFIMPLLLAMFGHGGQWFGHVSLRWGKRLALMLGLSFLLYLAGSGANLVVPAVPWVDFGLAGAVSVVAAMIYLAPTTILRLCGALGLLAAGVLSSLFGRVGLVGANEAAVEFKQLPLEHVRNKEETDQKMRQLRFQRFAQTLAESRLTVQFRLQFAGGFGRLFLSARGRKSAAELEETLVSLARTYLPEFKAARSGPPPQSPASLIMIKGVPEPSPDPLEPLARYFVENAYTGEYVISLRGMRPSPLSRFAAKRKQAALAAKAGRQTTVQRLDATSDSETPVDRLSQIEVKEAAKELERKAARRSVSAKVWVGAPNEGIAAGAVRVLIGTLSSNLPKSGLRIARRSSTLMLPSEAAPYLWIPEMSMGGELAPSAEFETPPPMKGEIELGEVVAVSGKRDQKARIPLDQLTKHVFLTGMTGSGKTTSAFGLLIQLHRLGVPFLVIEPAKSEYRSLFVCIPDLQVFTIGDEETAPLRLNIFEPPPGVKIQRHLENLQAVWNASFVSYAPLPYVVPQVFAQAYRSRGWYLAEDVRGKPVTFDDVRAQVEKVVDKLGYERAVTMDIEAALKARLDSLTLGGKGPLFGAISSTPLDAVLRRPTIIELKAIQNDEEKAFIAALILMNLNSWVEERGQSKHLEHFTLIEEAHRLLPNISTEKGNPESADPRRRAVEQFGDMLAELRAYGEGLAIVEQIPTKILPDAIKNTVTKVIHRVPAEDDRQVLAGAINATREQSAAFTALKPGEAVLGLESHPVPVRVEVENVISKLGMPVGEISDDEVRRRMVGFYLKNPVPREAPQTADRKLLELVDSEAFRAPFIEAYHAWWTDGKDGPLTDLLALVALKLARERDDLVDAASRTLSLAVKLNTTLDEKDQVLFVRAFMRAVGRSIQNARALR
jgi:DNA helicase HerA-like ATPase